MSKQNGALRSPTVISSIRQEPVTELRKPYMGFDGCRLVHPGTPRANIAPTHASPHGTLTSNWASTHAHQTVLQQHCDFFDQDRDSILWPSDTFIGFHRLGFSLLLCCIATFIIHLNFSYPTSPSWLPDPWFRIYLKRIDRTKHGSDSGTFDSEGRYVPQNFENIFAKYAGGREYLTIWDVVDMWWGQRCVNDPIGWGGQVFEWGVTWLMLWPEDGRMMKEDIRGVMDGSIFYTIAERRAKKKRGVKENGSKNGNGKIEYGN